MADTTTTATQPKNPPSESLESMAPASPNTATTPPATTVVVTKKKSGRVRRVLMPVLLIGVLGYAAYYGYHRFVYGKNHEDTDNAQIDGNIDPVLPRIAGFVTKVFVNENQPVTIGTPLVMLDTADLNLRTHTALTAIAAAETAVTVARANVNTAEVNLQKAEADLARDTRLLAGGAITQQQFDVTKTAAEAARSQIAAVRDQIAVAEAAVAQRHVDLDQARLQLTYTTIFAPSTGIVSKKNVEVGQYIQVAQPLMAITENDSIWVTANFKETQISDIKVGQPADIVVDAYPDTVFHGRVNSFSPATGAKFALLPPDNSTGNYVKVVQRVPVKILFDGTPNRTGLLRPGMSVAATITTK